jgi:hypothetical protein
MGFNMSWLFVDGIDEEALYTMLDLVATDVRPDPYDLGTSRVPLAGSRLKSGWSAVFAKYSLVMDAMFGTSPPRVARLPAPSRCLACVVLEHAMISYAGFWQDGRPVWEVRYDGGDHLEATGDLPAEFAAIRDAAMTKQRAKKPGPWGVDHLFDVALDAAAGVTNYRHDHDVAPDFFTDLRTLVPAEGNVLTRLSQPPTWWQTAGSIEYE